MAEEQSELRAEESPEITFAERIRRVWWTVPLTLVALLTDLVSKSVVFDRLGYPGHSTDAYRWLGSLSTFRFYTSFNKGALWGVGQELTWLFSALSVIAAGVIVYCLIGTSANRSRWLRVALSLVLSGTLGNLYDRLGLYKYKDPETGESIQAVRDFLFFTIGSYPWPVFNFADVFLVTGTGLLVVYSFWIEHQREATTGTTAMAG